MDLETLIRLGLATSGVLAGADASEVVAIKSATDKVNFRFSPPGAATKAAVDKRNRRITYAGSVEVVDRMLDLIEQKGWKLDEWKSHGSLFLWNHDHEAPIGQGFKAWRDTVKVPKLGDVPALMFDIGYVEEDLNPAAEVIWRMAAGIGTPTGKPMLRAVSVGLIADLMRQPTEEEREELGMDAWSVIYQKQRLLELSQAPVPANQYATQVAAGNKALQDADRRLRRDIDRAIDHMVDTDQITASLAGLFREQYGSSPGVAAERAIERSRSFVDMGSWDWGRFLENGSAEKGVAIAAGIDARPAAVQEDDDGLDVTEDEIAEEPAVEEQRAQRAASPVRQAAALEGVVVTLASDLEGRLQRAYSALDDAMDVVSQVLSAVEAARASCVEPARGLGMEGETEGGALTKLADALDRLSKKLGEEPATGDSGQRLSLNEITGGIQSVIDPLN